ncbi:RICIN domain-containing protein [Herbiconiux moechotypicola]|nr:RICIN domain-containing protein [Herbiconiux moechotypicola]
MRDASPNAATIAARTTPSRFGALSGKCLDLVGGSTANGTQAHVWSCHAGASQKWTLPQ